MAGGGFHVGASRRGGGILVDHRCAIVEASPLEATLLGGLPSRPRPPAPPGMPPSVMDEFGGVGGGAALGAGSSIPGMRVAMEAPSRRR